MRKTINEIYIGEEALFSRLLKEIVTRTKREDSVCMTLKELKGFFNGEEIPDVSERLVMPSNNAKAAILVFPVTVNSKSVKIVAKASASIKSLPPS